MVEGEREECSINDIKKLEEIRDEESPGREGGVIANSITPSFVVVSVIGGIQTLSG